MERITLLLVAVAITVTLTSDQQLTRADDSATGGSAPDAQGPGFQIALVDVAQIFKNHKDFKKKLEQMKKELAEAQARFELEDAQIKVFQERLKTLDVRSAEYLELEEKITTRKSTLQTRISREKRRFVQQEAAIYAQTYTEIRDAVEDYARDHDIRLVMRFNSQPIDETDSKSVMNGVNRNVVFQDGLDITAEIVRRVNERIVP
jgi:Skp family chaperone for outer membrane proteins